MSKPKPFKHALIGSTALVGASFLVPSYALAVSCPSNITDSSLVGIVCDFDVTTGSSVTVSGTGNVGGLNINSYAPAAPSFILNNGTISNPTSPGIIINSSSLSGGINNTGDITVPAATGILIANTSTIAGGISNSGIIASALTALRITNSSTITGGITNSGLISGGGNDEGIAILNNSILTGGILNNGTIQGDASGDGIIMNNSTISGDITNNGLISGGNDGFAVLNVSTINGSLLNSGTINGGNVGILLRSSSNISGGISNTGTVHGGNTGIAIDSATISGGISNTGTISGGNTGIRISNTATIAGGISNSGTIQGAVNAIAIDANATVSSVDLLNGSRIIGSINAPNTTLNVHNFQTEGSINVNQLNVFGNFTASNAITVGNNVNVVSGGRFTLRAGDTVTGDVTALSGGTFALGVGNRSFGQITGTADMSAGHLAVDVENSPLLHNGDLMNFAGVVVAPVSNPGITDNSFLWDFGLVGNAIRVIRAPAGSIGLNQADTSTYGVLQAFAAGNTTDPTMLQVLTNLNGASTRIGAQNVLQSVEPTLDGSDFVGAQVIDNQTLGIVTQQLAMLRGDGGTNIASLETLAPAAGGQTGMAAGGNGTGRRVWGQMFGAHANQTERDSIQGYRADSWGGALGIDTRNISDNAVVGVAFSYGATNANSKNSNRTGTDVNSYQLTLYGDYDLGKDVFVNGMLGCGWQNVDTSRYDVGGIPGLTAHGGFNTSQYVARAELGKNYNYGSALVTPSLLANYLHYSPDGYTETGAGSANLQVDRKDMEVFELGAGVKLSRMYNAGNGTFTPSVHGGVRYDLIGDSLDATNTFTAGGPAFDTRGIEPGRGTLDMGASVKYLTMGSWEFTADYDFEYKSNFTSSIGFLHTVYKF